MKLEVDLSNRNLYEFEKLNNESYVIWAFDVKYQFLKKKLWNLVSDIENPSIYRVSVSTAIETASLIVDVFATFQVNEEHRVTLSMWENKINAMYLIFVMTIIDRLQASIRQAISSMNAWNRLRDLYASINLQRRFALSRQLYSLHKKLTISMQ